jgi:hypothetical protein
VSYWPEQRDPEDSDYSSDEPLFVVIIGVDGAEAIWRAYREPPAGMSVVGEPASFDVALDRLRAAGDVVAFEAAIERTAEMQARARDAPATRECSIRAAPRISALRDAIAALAGVDARAPRDQAIAEDDPRWEHVATDLDAAGHIRETRFTARRADAIPVRDLEDAFGVRVELDTTSPLVRVFELGEHLTIWTDRSAIVTRALTVG